MDFHANHYSLVFISLSEEQKGNLFQPMNSESPLLVDSLRSDEDLCGFYQNTLVVSTPSIFDFMGDTPGPFAERMMRRFPSNDILATYHNSVIGARGLWLIKESHITDRYYQSDYDENVTDHDINALEDDFMLRHTGMLLPSFLGLGIRVNKLL